MTTLYTQEARAREIWKHIFANFIDRVRGGEPILQVALEFGDAVQRWNKTTVLI